MRCASGKCAFDQNPNHDYNPNINRNPNSIPNPNRNPIPNHKPYLGHAKTRLQRPQAPANWNDYPMCTAAKTYKIGQNRLKLAE